MYMTYKYIKMLVFCPKYFSKTDKDKEIRMILFPAYCSYLASVAEPALMYRKGTLILQHAIAIPISITQG